MATVMNQSHHRREYMTTRSAPQKVCIAMGIFFILAGLAGIVMPGLMGMHLSMPHNLIHLVSGALALWCGYADESRKAYNFSIGFGSIYGLLGIAGFILGQPGYPGVGHMEADQNLLRVIPNILEFGSNDHTLHILLSAVLLFTAYLWKRRNLDADRSIVDVQRRASQVGTSTEPDRDFFRTTGSTAGTYEPHQDVKNSDSALPHVDLGVSDVNRSSDRNRRADFERKL